MENRKEAPGVFSFTPNFDIAHIVPSSAECVACHGGTSGQILGFSAIQLPFDGLDSSATLSNLDAQGALTHGPADPFEIPGDEIEQQALGYLHANCSHCHNQERPPRQGAQCFAPVSSNDLDFYLRTDALDSLEATSTYRTAVGAVITAGDPGNSELLELISGRRFFYMPPLATDRVDDDAVELLRRWIETMD